MDHYEDTHQTELARLREALHEDHRGDLESWDRLAEDALDLARRCFPRVGCGFVGEREEDDYAIIFGVCRDADGRRCLDEFRLMLSRLNIEEMSFAHAPAKGERPYAWAVILVHRDAERWCELAVTIGVTGQAS